MANSHRVPDLGGFVNILSVKAFVSVNVKTDAPCNPM